MASEFEGSVVAVTGGSQGIGKAMAEAFAKKGAQVVIFARSASEVAAASAGISKKFGKCEGMALDVSDLQSVARAFSGVAKKHGRIDVLVACAGVYGPIGPLEGNDLGKWKDAIDVNLCGTVFCAHAALQYMKKAGKGCIIAMAGAGVGSPKIKPNFSAYTTSKFGICGFVEALGKELDGSGVRINAISPGAVNTRLLDEVLAAGDNAGAAFLEASKKQKETGGTPPEVACETALFLASGRAGHINGRIISAVWDKQDKLSLSALAHGSQFRLRRIDNELFSEKK